MQRETIYDEALDPFGEKTFTKAEVQSKIEIAVHAEAERQRFRGPLERAAGFSRTPLQKDSPDTGFEFPDSRD